MGMMKSRVELVKLAFHCELANLRWTMSPHVKFGRLGLPRNYLVLVKSLSRLTAFKDLTKSDTLLGTPLIQN